MQLNQPQKAGDHVAVLPAGEITSGEVLEIVPIACAGPVITRLSNGGEYSTDDGIALDSKSIIVPAEILDDSGAPKK